MSDDTITLDDLLAQCDHAMRHMSRKNHHRHLIAQLKLALIELASRLLAEAMLAESTVSLTQESHDGISDRRREDVDPSEGPADRVLHLS